MMYKNMRLLLLFLLITILAACSSQEEALDGVWKYIDEDDQEIEMVLQIDGTDVQIMDVYDNELELDEEKYTLLSAQENKKHMYAVYGDYSVELIFEGYFKNKDTFIAKDLDYDDEFRLERTSESEVKRELDKKRAAMENDSEDNYLANVDLDDNYSNNNDSNDYISSGEDMYRMSCAACHGQDLSGSVGPSLERVGVHMKDIEIVDVIVNGQGSMPGGLLNKDDAILLTDWLVQQY